MDIRASRIGRLVQDYEQILIDYDEVESFIHKRYRQKYNLGGNYT